MVIDMCCRCLHVHISKIVYIYIYITYIYVWALVRTLHLPALRLQTHTRDGVSIMWVRCCLLACTEAGVACLLRTPEITSR